MQTLQYDICYSPEAFSKNQQKIVIFSNYTSSYSDKIIANVCKSITMYGNKSEQVVNSLNHELTSSLKTTSGTNNQASNSDQTSMHSFTTVAPNQFQMKTLEYVNVTHDLYEQLRLMFNNDYKLNERLLEKLNNSLKSLLVFEENALSPFIASVSEYILAIMLTIHQEDLDANSSIPCSLYMKELQQVLQRIYRDYLKLYNCVSILNPYLNQLAVRCVELFIRHAAMVRPLSDKGRFRLVNDSQQLENIVQTVLCPKLTDLGILIYL